MPSHCRFTDSTTRESLAASQWGRSAQGPPAACLQTPSILRLPSAAKPTPRQVGRGRSGPQDICCFRSWPAAGPTPHARTRPRARAAGTIRPRRLARRRYLAAAVAPSRRPGTRPAVQSPEEGTSALRSARPELPRAVPRCGQGNRGMRPGFPQRGTAGEALRVAEPAPSPAGARRAHTGAHAPAHSLTRALCTLTAARAPPLYQEPRVPRTPARAPPSSSDPSFPLGCPGTLPPKPEDAGGRPAATHPGGRPGRRSLDPTRG